MVNDKYFRLERFVCFFLAVVNEKSFPFFHLRHSRLVWCLFRFFRYFIFSENTGMQFGSFNLVTAGYIGCFLSDIFVTLITPSILKISSFCKVVMANKTDKFNDQQQSLWKKY